MRPSLRFLYYALTASVLTALLLIWSPISTLGLIPWTLLGLISVTDVAISRLRSPEMKLDGPKDIFTGESVDVQAHAWPAFKNMKIAFNWPEGLSGPERIQLDKTGYSTFNLTARRRGAWPSGRMWSIWPTKLGLFECVRSHTYDYTIIVQPDIRPVMRGDINIAVHTALHGQKASVAEGEGSEFHQLREYTPGESLKRIDWKRSARQRRLVSKETRAEQNHHVIIALDNGYLMREELEGLAKLDHAIHAALAAAWAAAISGDQVGLFTYASRMGLWLPPEPGRQVYPKLRHALSGLDYESRESNHLLALAGLDTKLKRRSLVIVFSDFVDTTTSELMMEQIGRVAKKHLIIFIAIRDPETRRLAERPASSMDNAARSLAAHDMEQERKKVLERLMQLGVMVVDCEPDALTPRLISLYLDLKAREAA